MTLEAITGAGKLDRVRLSGNPFLESTQIRGALQGVKRVLLINPDFRGALMDQLGVDSIPITHREPWSVSFPAGQASYTVSGDGQYADEFHMERVVIARTEADSSNKLTLCEIPVHNDDERPHAFPRSELVVGAGRPLEGIPALAAMPNAFPELGFVWQ